MEENEKGKIAVTLDKLRRERKGEIIRLAEMRGCRNVRVFGSIVRAENRPGSDADFLVDLDSGRMIFDLTRFLGDRRDLLGTEVDVVESRSIHPYHPRPRPRRTGRTLTSCQPRIHDC